MHKTLVVILAVLLLGSCVGIESRIVLKDNGSGTLSLTYRVSQLIVDLGRSGEEKGPAPLPVAREDFERSLSGVSGVTLKSYKRTEDEKDVTIQAEIAFDSVESLAHVSAFRDAGLRFAVDGKQRTFTQVLARASAQEASADSLAMIDEFFSGYKLSYSVETPSPIQSASLGILSQDRRAVSYATSIQDVVRLKQDIVLTLTW